MADNGIRNGSTIHLTVRLRGGGGDTRQARSSTRAPSRRRRTHPEMVIGQLNLVEDSSDGSIETRTLFLGNLPRQWTTIDVERASNKFGRVARANMFYNREGGSACAAKVVYTSEVCS